MKIVHKIHVINISAIILIAMVAFFSYQNLNLVLTKLRFMEIADDLNASFLEMRLSEKNLFLYHDGAALLELRQTLSNSLNIMDSVKGNIIRATGKNNFAQLKSCFTDYLHAVQKIKKDSPVDIDIQQRVREAGQKLREFSSRITRLERNKTNEIIAKSRNGLFTSLCLILLSAIAVSYLFFFNIFKSLKKIKKVARSISRGQYREVDTDIPRDEIGSVLKAINLMSKELKRREEQIIQSKKLASIGILTAGVAHELGNPLNNISMIAQTFTELYDKLSQEDRIGFMRMVEEETERIRDIVKNLLDFSKPKKGDVQERNINGVLKKSLKLVQNMLHVSNINIQLNLQENLPPIFIDENRILEVIVNLITNSIHATDPGGQMILETRLNQEKNQVEILVTDTGKGIPAEFLPNLFDPFFSTKGTSGTGLGLFVSYGIIKNHGGTIDVSSQVGVGTTFTIKLPVQPGISPEPQSA